MADNADEERVLLCREGAVAFVTLNRPERLNAMDRRMLEAFAGVLDRLEADSEVRAIVIAGAGRAFSSGFDLKEQAALRPRGEEPWREILDRAFATVMRCWRLSKPTIAAVRGPCLAGGCELALACDITIAGDDAVFGEPEVRFGAGIVVMILPWLVGAKRAKDIILTGRHGISAMEALAMGMVSRVVPADDVLATAASIAHQIAAIDPVLIATTKRSINRAFEIMGLERALREALDGDVALEAIGTADKAQFLDIAGRDGLGAALRWRDGRFEGRFDGQRGAE